MAQVLGLSSFPCIEALPDFGTVVNVKLSLPPVISLRYIWENQIWAQNVLGKSRIGKKNSHF